MADCWAERVVVTRVGLRAVRMPVQTAVKMVPKIAVRTAVEMAVKKDGSRAVNWID